MTAATSNATARSADRIEEQVRLPQPRARVWRALTDPAQLGAWFGADLAGTTIEPGAHVTGPFTIPGHTHMSLDIIIEEMVAERRFAWRWHPNATDTSVPLSGEPRTLVTFTFEDAPEGGTLLRVVESGFESIADARRAAAILGNTKGWTGQLTKRLPAWLAANA